MPVAVSYPGVYIEEIPSGVHTITGVATSITAFAGWAPKGPTDSATLVLSFADFARTFGGLDNRSLLGYAVNQFFANGGQKAYIVRLIQAAPAAGAGAPAAGAPAAAAPAAVTLDGKLTITASNPGLWANDYAIVTKKRTDKPTNFRLSVVNWKLDPAGITIESFENLSMHTDDPRYVVNVLKAESQLIIASIVGGATDPPADTASGAVPDSAKLTGGLDGDVLVPNNANAAFESALIPPSKTGGVFYLDRVDLFNLLCVPGETTAATLSSLEQFCHVRRAFLIADCAQGATVASVQNLDGSLTGADAINAALYFPWLIAPDPLQQNRAKEFPPCGFIAGIYSRTDSSRGVWKAPAGTEASLSGASGVRTTLTNDENGVLNPVAVNCIRNFPVYGTVVWGSRTLQGNDERGSEWKYVPIRRTALFIEESLYRGTQWVVFEPNDEPLWAQIRLNVGVFMHDLFRQGAFQGKTPQAAYFVKCDSETTTQSDINRGVVNIVVGFAPLKPAEFVIIKLQQIAGQLQT